VNQGGNESEEIRDVEDRIYRIEMQQARFEKLKGVVEVIAIVTAGIWAFYQFIYQDRIVPTLQTPSLTVSIKLEALGTKGAWRAIRMTESYNNTSKSRVSVLARSIDIYGQRISEARPGNAQFVQRPPGQWTLDKEYNLSKPVMLITRATLFEGNAGSANRRWWFQPGDTSERSAIFYVRSDEYDLLTATEDIEYTKYAVEPQFTFITAPSGVRMLRAADRCVDLDESARCPITSEQAQAQLSLW
jgi:hypothetical protein